MVRRLNWKAAGEILLLLFLSLILVASNTIVVYRHWVAFTSDTEEAARTQPIVGETNALLSSLNDAETGERGFLPTGRERYPEPYKQALEDIPKHLDSLRNAKGIKADQILRIDKIKPLTAAGLNFPAPILTARESQGPEAALAMSTDPGQAAMNQIRAICSDIVAASYRELGRVTEFGRASAERMGILNLGGSVVLVGILAFSFLAIRRGRRRRQALIEDLRQNQKLLAIFVHNVPAAVAMLDRDLRYVQVSDRWCSEFHLDPSQILGRSHYETFVEIPEHWKEMHRRCMAGETLRSDEDIFGRSDGSRARLRWEIRPWGNRLGAPEGILIFAEDITQRESMEESLRKAQENFRALTDNSPDAISRFDRECRYTFANSRVLKMMGLTEEAIIGKRPDELAVTSESAPKLLGTVQRIFSTGQPETSEVSYKELGGETFWEVRFIPEFGGDGSVASVLRIGRDITERRAKEIEATERKNLISTLVETAAQAILSVDAGGNIQFVNRMAEEVFGYRRHELLGRPLEVLLPQSVWQKRATLRNFFLSTPKRLTRELGIEMEGRRKDGSVFPIEVSLSSVETIKGVLAVAFLSDITQRKQNELALREADAALLSAEEDAARRIALELHDDITQQLAFLSMEIGKTAATPGVPAKLLEQLRFHQAKILGISQDVRHISHQMHPSILEDLGLSAALKSMCHDLTRLEGMQVDFVSRGVPGNLDRRVAFCFYRVCQECLRNIVEHAQAQDAIVGLLSDGEWLELTIIDSGIGFDSAKQKPGLGTQSMKERVRMANGILSIDSEPGHGTRVVVQVPLNGKIANRGSVHDSGPPRQNKRRPSVIVADDDDEIRQELIQLLSKDYELVEVADGRQLVDMACGKKPDALIVDISLPGLNGFEAVQEIKSNGVEAKVIFFTTNANPHYMRKAMDLGATGYVLKAVSVEELPVALRAVLSGGTFISPSLGAN